MKKTILLALSLLIFAGQQVFASVSIDCGKLSKDKLSVEKIEYAFSSESDDFTGPVGKKWDMKISGLWLGSSKNASKVTSKMFKDSQGHYFTATVASGQSVTGVVGKTYTVKYLYTDNPQLEVRTKGGFAGSTILKQVECVGSYD